MNSMNVQPGFPDNLRGRIPEARTRKQGRVLVIGAGVVGISTAYALARSGFRVTVIDRAADVATGTSFANGAQLSYCYTDSFACPEIVTQLPALFIGSDSAIRVTPTLSTDFVRWSLSFMRNCTKSRFQQNTLALLQLALESRAAMHALTARHPLQFDYRPSKKMVLYRDEAALEHARRRTAMKNQLGVGQEILSPAEAAAREPSLSELTSTFVGAIWSPMDEAGDARAFCCALAEMLRSEYDVKFLLNTEVVGFEKNRDRIVSLTTSKGNIESDYFVATLGIETRSLLRPLGIKLPLWPARGYSVTLPATAKAPTISLTDASRKIVFCRLGDCLRIAGGFEIGSWEQANSIVQPVRDLIERARAALPAAAEYGAEAHPWTGVRPITPSSQPIIGRSTVPRLYVNCGHGALGWTLAMGAADRLRSVLEEDAG